MAELEQELLKPIEELVPEVGLAHHFLRPQSEELEDVRVAHLQPGACEEIAYRQ